MLQAWTSVPVRRSLPHEHRGREGSEDAIHPVMAPFFQPSALYPMNQPLRGDAHKWETCLHRRIDKRATGLDGPIFDIQYNARSEGRSTGGTKKIRYALVLSVEAPRGQGSARPRAAHVSEPAPAFGADPRNPPQAYGRLICSEQAGGGSRD